MCNWIQENAVDLIGHALALLGIIAAALIVVWQLRRQHKSSLALQRDNAREALNLRVYESLLQKVRTLSDANIAAAMYAFGIPPVIEIAQRGRASGYEPSPLNQRVPEFSALHFKAENELAELLVEFEAWAIAFPAHRVFHVALNAAAYDVRQAFPPLFETLLRILPMDPPQEEVDKPTIHQPLPSAAYLSVLKHQVTNYKAAMDKVGSYIHDLTIEAQNNLLSSLFDRTVPPRKPLDPRLRVISTDREKMEELIKYFENETPWGKHQAEINADVAAEVGSKTARGAQKGRPHDEDE